MRNLSLYFCTAGLVSLSYERPKSYHSGWTFHLFVKPSHWTWGKAYDWYDGPITYYGLGPLFLLVKA